MAKPRQPSNIDSITKTHPSDRDAKGRFAQGWRGGPGRPRGSVSLASELKRLGSPTAVAEVVLNAIMDPATPARERLGYVALYADRCWGKAVATSVTMRMSASQILPPSFFALDVTGRRKVLDEIRRRALMPGDAQQLLTDGDHGDHDEQD
jgi:hypothetical protein